MVFSKDSERILETLLKSLSQTETLLKNIINFILKISNKQFTKKCNCKKYFLSKRKYTLYSTHKNTLKILVKRCISLKFFCDDVTGNINYNTNQVQLDTSSDVNFKSKLEPCCNMNIFLGKANTITKLSSDPHILVTQILTFLELISDILVSVCSLPQPYSEIEILSGILVADVYCLHEKYNSLWHELNRVVGNFDNMNKPVIHSKKCKKSKHLSSLFFEFKKQISVTLREICKVKFYFNDFVIFVEHFKLRTFQQRRLISENCSSIANETILSNEDLYSENGNLTCTHIRSYYDLPLFDKCSNDKNKKSFNKNCTDFISLVLEDHLIVDKNTDVKEGEVSHNSLNYQYKPTKQRRKKSIDETGSEKEIFNFSKIIFPEDNITKKIDSLGVINEENGNIYLNALKNNKSYIISSDMKNNIVDNHVRSFETLFMNQSMSIETNLKPPKSAIETNKESSLIELSKIEKNVNFDNLSKEKNKTNFFLRTNGNKTIDLHKMDKSNQIINSSHGCTSNINHNSFKNSVDVATQIILESIDESSQTVVFSGFCESTVNILLKTENVNEDVCSETNFSPKPLNMAKNQHEKKDFKKLPDIKWPVDGYYIPLNYRSKIKKNNCFNKYSHNICSKMYGNKNSNSNSNYIAFKLHDSKKSKQLQYSLNTLGENIYKKNRSGDLTTESSKYMHLLNPKYVKYNKSLPYGVSSYQLGLSNIWFKCTQDGYKVYPSEVCNLVKNTVYYYNSKTRTNRNEINLESVMSVLTCNNATDIDTSRLSSVENKLLEKTKRGLSNQEKNIYVSENDFRLFDINGYPLTDIFGNTLNDPYGHSVINTALLKPLSNIVVYDASLTPSTSCDFNPYLKKSSNKIGIQLSVNNRPLLMFDKYSRPLTDSSGRVLSNNEGQILLLFNNIGCPISDFKGGELYLENGTLWSSGQENINTFFKRVEKCEYNCLKEPNKKAEIRSDFTLNKPQVMDEKSLERIKTKIQEPLPIIDDLDFLSPGIEFQTSDLNQDIKQNLKSLPITTEGSNYTASLIKNNSFIEEKKYKNLNNVLNFKVDLYSNKDNKLEVSDSLSEVDNSVFSLNSKAKNQNKSINFETYQNNYEINRFHHKTSTDNILSTSNSIRKVQHIVVNPVSEVIIPKSSFNIEDNIKKRKSNTNQMFNFLDEYLVKKQLLLSSCPNNTIKHHVPDRIHVLDFIGNHSNCEYLECNSNYKSQKCLVHTKMKHHERTLKQNNQRLKTRLKLFKTKKTNRLGNKTPKISNLIPQIYLDNNETKPTIFKSCFHAPVQFLLDKLDATFLHKDNVIKKEIYNIREKQKIYENKKKVNDKRKAKKEGTIDKPEKLYKLHLDNKEKLKQTNIENTITHKQIDLVTKNTRRKISVCDNYNNLLNPVSCLGNRNNNFRSKCSNFDFRCSFKKSRNPFTKESDIGQLMNKYKKPSIPSKILNSPKPSLYSSVNKFLFTT